MELWASRKCSPLNLDHHFIRTPFGDSRLMILDDEVSHILLTS